MSSDWLSAEEAQSRLGVKLQTLYAYVSRGQITAVADPNDPRRSRYAADDIERLSRRKTRGRRAADHAGGVMTWTEEPVSSNLSSINGGRLFYRGRDAVEFAETGTLEDLSRLLWKVEEADPFLALAPHPSVAIGPDAKARAFSLLAYAAANGAATSGRTDRALQREAAALLTDFVDAVCGQVRNGALHDRLARAWRVEGPKALLIRRALVLAADQQMNPASLAVRIAASTGAPLAASVLAGLAIQSGPLAGGGPAQVAAFLAETRRAADPKVAAAQRLAQGLDVPGFGDALFPEGDPRARALAAAAPYPADLAAMAEACEQVTGAAPNLEFALVALARAIGLPGDAPAAIIMIGQVASWLGHAIEQRVSGEAIRPREEGVQAA